MKKLFKFAEKLLYDSTIEEEHFRKLRQKSSSGMAIIVGLVAAVGGFLYGYDTGLINDILEMNYVTLTFPANNHTFTSHERALITAILSLGTFVGALAAPLISDNYGRKFSIIVSSAIIFNVGNLLQVLSSTVTLLCIGRAVLGVSVGMLSAIVPLYQAEASPRWVRGSIVFTYQWAITWGLLIASAVCQGTRLINNSASYRIPIGLQFLWALILCTGMLFLPESPRYYVQKNELEKALDSLTKLRRLPPNDPDLIEELVEIKANYDYELSFGKTTIKDCFRNGGGRHKQVLRMITGIGVMTFQQCSGINFIFYYGVNFFASSGMKNYYLMSFTTYVVNMVFTIPGIILVDVIGRRLLMLWGGVGMCVSNFLVAVTGVAVKNEEAASVLSISFSCVFIAFFASSWGGAVWAIASDIYGISIRQQAVSVTTATNWLVNFIFAYITPYLIDTGTHTAALGNKIFFVWGGCNALGVVFVYFAVYETKGLKLEEVDFMYVNCSSARLSSGFKSRKIDYAMFNNTYNNIVQNSNVLSNVVSRTHSLVSHNSLVDSICSHNYFNNTQESDKNKDPKTNVKTTSTTTTATTGSSAENHLIKLLSISPTSSKKEHIAMVPYDNTLGHSFSTDSDTSVEYPKTSKKSTSLKSGGIVLTDRFELHDPQIARKTGLARSLNSEKSEKSAKSAKSEKSGNSVKTNSAKSVKSTTSANSTNVPISEESNDYQEYLDNLKKDYRSVTHPPPPNLFNRGSLLLRKKGRRPSETTEQSVSESESRYMPIILHVPSFTSEMVGSTGGIDKTTIIATPFFNQPPSDSDSD